MELNKLAQKVTQYLGYFVTKFVSETFKNISNLVTLLLESIIINGTVGISLSSTVHTELALALGQVGVGEMIGQHKFLPPTELANIGSCQMRIKV